MKNRLKRLMAAMLALCMSFTMLYTFAAADTSGDTVIYDGYAEDEKMLRNLGIIKLDITDPMQTLTRAEFLDMAMRVYYEELPECSDAGIFSDVIPNHKYICAIESAFSAGFVKGVGNSEFGADMTINAKAALTIMMRMLNYEYYYNNFGQFAECRELINAADISGDEFTYADAVRLIAKSIELPVMKRETYPDVYSYKMDEAVSLIGERRDIEVGAGQLTAAGNAALDGSEAEGGEYVKINDRSFRDMSGEAEGYIGYTVKFYYDKERNEIYHMEDAGSYVTVIDEYMDACSYSGGRLSYSTNGKNTKSIQIPVDAIIVYNGKLIRGGQMTAALFDIDNGYIKIIKEAYKGRTVVNILSYSSIVFGGVIEQADKYVLVDKFNSSGAISIADEEEFEIVNSRGESLTLSDIPEDAVLSVALSLDCSCGRIIVNETGGKLEQALVVRAGKDYALIKSFKEAIHTYEEKEYKYSGSFEALNKAQGIVSADNEYTVYMDVFGAVVYMDMEQDMSDFYAYLMGISVDGAFDEVCTIRLCSDEGKVNDYALRKNAIIDGVSVKGKTGAEIRAILNLDGAERLKAAYVSLSYNSEIVSIDTCPDATEAREADYSLYKSDREKEDTLYKLDPTEGIHGKGTISGYTKYYSTYKSFSSGVFITNDTKMLAVPLDSTDTRRFMKITPGFFRHDENYRIEAYARDDDALIPEFLICYYYSKYSPEYADGIIKDSKTPDGTRYAAKSFNDSYDMETGICTSCSQELNEDTGDIETAVTITNVKSGVSEKYYLEDSSVTDGIQAGQLVRYHVMNEQLFYIEELYNIETDAFNTNPRVLSWTNDTASATKTYTYKLEKNNTFLRDGGSKDIYPIFSVAKGYIMDSKNGYLSYVIKDDYLHGNITGSDYLRVHYSTGAKVLRYNKRDGSVETKSFDDMASYKDSEVFATEAIIVVSSQQVVAVIIK